MIRYILRRLVYGLVTLLALSIVVFALLQWAGGSPLDRLRLNTRLAPRIPEFIEFFGLDKPAPEQYWIWLRNFVTPARFDVDGPAPLLALGLAALFATGLALLPLRSPRWIRFRLWSFVLGFGAAMWFAKSRIDFALNWSESFQGLGPVWDLVMGSIGATLRLGLAALALIVLVGIPIGIYQAVRQYSVFDQLSTSALFVAWSTPEFVVAMALQLVMALQFQRWTGIKLFYVAGMTDSSYASLGERLVIGPLDLPSFQQLGDISQHLFLPAAALALVSIATLSRFQRASMLEVMHSDYLRTARAKGLPKRRVVLKHAFRNALVPVVTVLSLSIAYTVGGAIIVERVFGWPGVGPLYLDAVDANDYPVVLAVVMTAGAAIVVMNIVADILYGVLDPRVRYD